MKKRLIFLILFFILVLIFANMLASTSLGEKFGNVKVDATVYEKLEQEGKVRVIVRLHDEPQIIQKALGKIRTQVIEKESVINSLSTLSKEEFNLVYKASSINGFTAEISVLALQELKKNPAIKYIKIEPEIKLFLQDSVPLINATLVWPVKVSNINITGEGQTVCIVDTGINYTHADLGSCLGPISSGCRVLGGFAFYNPFNSSNKTDVMDDNGHGTHVAGIAGANGSITGVAPGVNFVAVKACGPTIDCGAQEVIDSVNWCVGNSSRYNISVISMSLGGGSYASYCDDEDTDMTAAIDGAIAKNITVVVATGNSGSTTNISWPACIRNSTAVGAVNKNDGVTYNRNNITIVLAPGVSITSTSRTGGYESMDGTSMSTPHVSGAVALLKQYKKLEKNTNLTTVQIKDVLNRTGKRISDASSGLNLSRINVYAALVAIDETAPSLALSEPENITYTSNLSLALNFSVSDNLNLSDCLYSIDSAANVSLQNCQNSTFNTTLGSHTFTLYALDSAGNINFSSVVFYVNEAPVVNLSLPLNSTSTTAAMQTFSCNASDSSGLQNITFYIWNSTALVHINTSNKTGETYNQTNFSFALPYEGVFKWNCKAYDNLSSFGWALNYTISYDTTAPNVSLIEPENGTNYTAAGNISFSFNVTDLIDIANCSLIINSALNATLTNPTKNITNNISIFLNNGAYNWSVNCTDTANNVGASSKWQLTVNVSTVTDYNISACRNITQAGRYASNRSINNSANSVCINISVSDVEIDCQSYLIDGVYNPSTYGILAYGNANSKISNVTVRNCNVTDWFTGVAYYYVDNSTIENNEVKSNQASGIYLNVSSYNTISHNFVNTSAISAGIELILAEYNLLANNTMNNNSRGLHVLVNSSHNRFINNTITRSVYFTFYLMSGAINNTIIGLIMESNAEGITFTEAAGRDNVLVNITTTNNTGYDINITDTNATIRNSIFIGYAFYNSIINLENSSYASIGFPNVTQNGTNFSADVVLRYNYIFINSSSAPGLNRSANLSLYGLSFSNPRILRDGAVCPSSICTKIAYTSSNGTLIFNVISFSLYSAEETPTTQQTVSSGGGGGGGGTAAGKTYIEGTLKEGKEVNRLLEKNDKIKFMLRNNEHNLTVKSVTQDNATFELNSTSLKFTLFVGESKKFNLTDEKFYDLFIKLNSIENFKANLSMIAIYELIPLQKTVAENITNITKPEEKITIPTSALKEKPQEEYKLNTKVIFLGVLIVIIIITILLYNFYKNLKEKKAKEKLKEGKHGHVRKKWQSRLKKD